MTTIKRESTTTPKPLACIKCAKGPDEVIFKWRTDRLAWKNVCNTCYNAKNYSKASRVRCREEDEEGFLARNAAQHREWLAKNKDKVKKQQRRARIVQSDDVKTYVELV